MDQRLQRGFPRYSLLCRLKVRHLLARLARSFNVIALLPRVHIHLVRTYFQSALVLPRVSFSASVPHKLRSRHKFTVCKFDHRTTNNVLPPQYQVLSRQQLAVEVGAPDRQL